MGWKRNAGSLEGTASLSPLYKGTILGMDINMISALRLCATGLSRFPLYLGDYLVFEWNRKVCLTGLLLIPLLSCLTGEDSCCPNTWAVPASWPICGQAVCTCS